MLIVQYNRIKTPKVGLLTMNKPTKKLQHSDIINTKVEFALVGKIYEQANIGFIVSIICSSLILFYLHYGQSMKAEIYLWYVIFVTIALSRVLLAGLFFKNLQTTINITLWRRLFTAGALLGGLMWGVAGTPLILPMNDPLEQAFILMILAGITAGSVPLNAYLSKASMIFIISALLPLTIHFLLIPNLHYEIFGITTIIFMTFLIILTFKTHRVLYESLYLQFEHDELLIELSNAKNRLEITNKRLQQEATHDPLTHVANRHLFEVILQDAINQADHNKQNLALFYLDLDKFKDVNDTYGHHAGDELLLVVIARIKNILRDNDTVARVGGDELTIILENATHFETIAEIAQRICLSIAKPIKIDHAEVHVYASIGIAMYPSDAKDLKTLIQIADKAMYVVKENGGNSFHFGLDST